MSTSATPIGSRLSTPDTGASRIATPTKPAAIPPAASADGRRRVTAASNTASQMGTVAIRTAAMPDRMYSSASTTNPLPPSSSRMPTIATARHWGTPTRSGREPPMRPRAHRKRSISRPATTNRTPAASSGGSVSTITAMAR